MPTTSSIILLFSSGVRSATLVAAPCGMTLSPLGERPETSRKSAIIDFVDLLPLRKYEFSPAFVSSLVRVTRSVSTGIFLSVLSIWRLTLQLGGRFSVGNAGLDLAAESSPSVLRGGSAASRFGS